MIRQGALEGAGAIADRCRRRGRLFLKGGDEACQLWPWETTMGIEMGEGGPEEGLQGQVD